MALTTNIVHSFPLTANSNDVVGSLTGTDTSISYGSVGGNLSASFNGSSSKVIESGYPIDGSGDFTIAFWIYVTSFGSQFYVIDNRKSPTDDNLGIWNIYFNTAGKFNFWDFNGGAFGFPSSNFNTTALSTNTWYHVAFTRTGGTAGQYYLNGATDGTNTAAAAKTYSTNNTDHPLKMGVEGESLASFFPGSMTELDFWTRALSGAEITQLYNAGTVLRYPFGSSVGSGMFNFFLQR